MFKGLGVKPWRIPTWIWRVKEEQDPSRVDEIEQRNVRGETEFGTIRESKGKESFTKELDIT